MISTNDSQFAALCRAIRAHGWSRDQKSGSLSQLSKDDFQAPFEFVVPGFCVRPIEFMGAVGSVQLQKASTTLSQRRENAVYFLEKMDQFSDDIDLQEALPYESSWFGFAMILKNKFRGRRPWNEL